MFVSVVQASHSWLLDISVDSQRNTIATSDYKIWFRPFIDYSNINLNLNAFNELRNKKNTKTSIKPWTSQCLFISKSTPTTRNKASSIFFYWNSYESISCTLVSYSISILCERKTDSNNDNKINKSRLLNNLYLYGINFKCNMFEKVERNNTLYM